MAEDEVHLKKIVEILADSVPAQYGLVSIILYGGFARGEGRIIEAPAGKIPYGDYDLMVVTRNSLPENFISRILEEKIYKEVMFGTSIDITNETIATLRAINCDLSSYDLLKSGKTIWGEELLDKIKMDIEDVPLISFWRILNNRLNVILMEYESEHGELKPEKRTSLKKSIIKLYLDMGGYLAFKHKRYSPFFEERLRGLREIKLSLEQSFPGLIEKIESATRQKLNPELSAAISFQELKESLAYGLRLGGEMMREIMDGDFDFLEVREWPSLIYKKLPCRYYQDYLAWAWRDQPDKRFLRKFFPSLSILANLYENFYFRKQAITKDKFSFGCEWRSPIIINMAMTIPLVLCLLEGKKNYLQSVGYYLKKIRPFGLQDNFEEIKRANTELWFGYTRRARKRNIKKALSDLFI